MKFVNRGQIDSRKLLRILPFARHRREDQLFELPASVMSCDRRLSAHSLLTLISRPFLFCRRILPHGCRRCTGDASVYPDAGGARLGQRPHLAFDFASVRPPGSQEIGEARPKATRLPLFNFAYFSHPEQEAQHSSEAQHDAFAALTAPVKPSATTATNRIALILFMGIFSFTNERGCCQANSFCHQREVQRIRECASKYEGRAS